MRSRRFVGVHRGGELTREQQVELMRWACVCARRWVPRAAEEYRERLWEAIATGEAWADGVARAGDCMRAAREVHAAARTMDPLSCAVARVVGHAVATAHAGDHALGVVIYGATASKLVGLDADAERRWQLEQLPPSLRELVVEGLRGKGVAVDG